MGDGTCMDTRGVQARTVQALCSVQRRQYTRCGWAARWPFGEVCADAGRGMLWWGWLGSGLFSLLGCWGRTRLDTGSRMESVGFYFVAL